MLLWPPQFMQVARKTLMESLCLVWELSNQFQPMDKLQMQALMSLNK